MSQTEAHNVLETAVQNQPKKRGCRRGCVIWFLVLGVLFWWFCIHTSPLRFSKETTYVTEPLSADGKRIDYFRAWEEHFYPKEMKTDDNGYRIFVRGVGDLVGREYSKFDGRLMESTKLDIDPEVFRLQVYEKLGLDPNEKPTLNTDKKSWSAMSFIYDLSRQQTDKDESKRILEMQQGVTTNPWTLEKYPLMKKWIEQADPFVDLVGEAVRRPTFYIPQVRGNPKKLTSSLYLNELSTMRDVARSVQARANYRIGIGDIDGAINDNITIYRLGRHLGRQGLLVNYLGGLAIEGVAASLMLGGNPAAQPSKEQWERLLREIDALPPRWTADKAIGSERLYGLGGVQAYADGVNPADEDGYLDGYSAVLYFVSMMDVNVVMSEMNKAYDAMESGKNNAPGNNIHWLLSGAPGTKQSEMDEPSGNPLQYFSAKSRSRNFARVMISLLLPATEAAREAERRTICTENLKHLTLALLLYEKDHGKFPDGSVDWRKAVEKYLGANPDQYFRCPSCYMPEDYTTYALVHRQGGIPSSPNTILLVEAFPPMKLHEGDGTILEEQVFHYVPGKAPALTATTAGVGSFHGGGYETGFRNGAVRFMGGTMKREDLQKLLDGTATAIP